MLLALYLAACGRVAFEATSDGALSDDASDILDAPGDAQPCTPITECTQQPVTSSCNGVCFTHCPDLVPQGEALDRCSSWLGQLLTIRSPEDLACVMELGAAAEAWIGYTQAAGAVGTETDWTWMDGGAWPAVTWSGFEPNDVDNVENGDEQCAVMYPNGLMNDLDCPNPNVAITCAR